MLPILPNLASFRSVIANRKAQDTPRATLVRVLQEQYQSMPANPFVDRNIAQLANENSYCITTAHQPSLFLGPLYFVYKAISAINLADSIQQSMGPDVHIVPVFVLGSEDHDLEELNYVHLFNKTLRWEPGLNGPVGPMSTNTLQPVLEQLREVLGDGEQAQYLWKRLERAYTHHSTFAAATQAFLHDLMGRYGLVVFNMNHPDLKRHFIPIMREELLEQSSLSIVQETAQQLNQLGFKTQATPREINLFYLQDGSRERIVLGENIYKILNTTLEFSREALLAELEAHPDRFSPNVVLRPLFQEIILPNLAYIGGGGELAYWLERKAQFAHFGVHFPVLVRRNSVLWVDRDSSKRLNKLGLKAADFFDDTDAIIRLYIATNAASEVDLEQEITDMHLIFDRLAQKAAAVDPTLEKAVRADEVRQLGALEQWQGRIVRAEKQKHEVAINQIRNLKEKLFPGNGMQERFDNFIPYYLKYGEYFLDTLKENLDPLQAGLIILEEPLS
ncbi:MAG: bacillithiol biosynthesis cysteine-adding enzyme BshC [Lewinellaceae bacterium]|nr:bacillithiol biosynthesis cysteine-adding enzyme BshC [Lewinellaceae bacterium]